MTNDLNDLLCAMLDCGYADLEYLNQLLDDTGFDVETILDELYDEYGNERITFNALVFTILYGVVSKSVEKLSEQFPDITVDDFQIFTNYLDSSISLSTIKYDDEERKKIADFISDEYNIDILY